jgi:hypothetical protein
MDIDPITLLERLTPEAIEARLDALMREEWALRVLLRSVRSRRRERQGDGYQQKEAAVHA